MQTTGLTISNEEANVHLSADGRRIVKNPEDGCRATKRKRGTRVRDLRESQQVRAWANMSNVEKRQRISSAGLTLRVGSSLRASRLARVSPASLRPLSGAELAWTRSKVKPTSIHHVWIIRPAFRLSPRLLAKFMCRRSLRSLPTLSANSSSCVPAPAATRRFAITTKGSRHPLRHRKKKNARTY